MSLLRLGLTAVLGFTAVVCFAAPSPQHAQDPASAKAQPDTEAAWKRTSEEHAAMLTQRFGTGTDTALGAQLLSLLARDRQARGLEPGPQAGPDGHSGPARNLRESDTALSAELRALVEAHGWPTVALVGLAASNAAMVVLTHAPDHDWQRALLPVLEELADAGKIDAAPLAVVIDKELVSEGKLQRYGTQFRAVHGTMLMYAVEDPAALDKRRERTLLPPIELYRAMLSRMYGLPAGASVVAAAPETH